MSRYFNRLAGRSGLKTVTKSNSVADSKKVVASQLSMNHQQGNQSADHDMEIHQEHEAVSDTQIQAPVITTAHQLSQTSTTSSAPVDTRAENSESDQGLQPTTDQVNATNPFTMKSTQARITPQPNKTKQKVGGGQSQLDATELTNRPHQHDKHREGPTGKRLGGQEIATTRRDVLGKNLPVNRDQDTGKAGLTESYKNGQALEHQEETKKAGLMDAAGNTPGLQKPADNIEVPQSEVSANKIKITDLEHKLIEVKDRDASLEQPSNSEQSVVPAPNVSQPANQMASKNPRSPTSNNIEIRIGNIDLEVHQATVPSPTVKAAVNQSDAKWQGNNLSRYYLKGL